MPLSLEYAFTIHVNFAEPLNFGKIVPGTRQYIPILGGHVDGPKLNARILPGGGDWNASKVDGVVHVFGKYSLRADDGTLINFRNEGYGRAMQGEMGGLFATTPSRDSIDSGDCQWYTKTNPRFDVKDGPHGWLSRSVFLGDVLPPTIPNHVKIEVYEVK